MDRNISTLKNAIQEISLYVDERKPVSFGENIYQVIFETAKGQSVLRCQGSKHDIFQSIIEDHMMNYMNNKVKIAVNTALASTDPFDIIRVISKYSSHVRKMSKILQLLFSSLMNQNEKKKSVFEIVYEEWYNQVIQPYAQIISNSITQIIQNYRTQYPINKEELKELTNIIIEIDGILKKNFELYENIIEIPLQISTATFFQSQSSSVFYASYILDYLEKVKVIIESEKYLIDNFLHTRSYKAIMDIVYNEMIGNKLTEILKQIKPIFTNSIDNKDTYKDNDILTIYKLLLYREDDLKLLANVFLEIIKEKGSQINEKDKVNDIVRFFDKCNKLVQTTLNSHFLFLKALKDGFESFINKDVGLAKLLAQHLHKVLLKSCTLKEDEKTLIRTNVMFIYTYLVNKDIFEAEYHKYLASRLLDNTSASDVEEKQVIDLFKSISGSSITSKFESMFQDIVLSRNLMSKFRMNDDLEFDCTVCRLGCWPTQQNIDIPIPLQLTSTVSDFTKFYKTQYPDRSVNFDMHFGECELNVTIENISKIVLVSSIQMIILLQVSNSSAPVSIKEIMDKNKLSFVEVVDHLMSLAHPDYAILQKKPASRDLKEDHLVRMSPKWSPKVANTKRFKVNLVSFDDLKQIQPANVIDKDVQMNRIFLIESSIVRAMKIKKRLNYNELFFEVQNTLKTRFEVVPNVVRSCIDHLIEQDYMERDEEDRSCFLYIA